MVKNNKLRVWPVIRLSSDAVKPAKQRWTDGFTGVFSVWLTDFELIINPIERLAGDEWVDPALLRRSVSLDSAASGSERQ